MRWIRHGDPHTVTPPQRWPGSGRKKGSYFYSDADLLGAYRHGDSEARYEERTGIAHGTIFRRFESWKAFKALAEAQIDKLGTMTHKNLLE